LLKQFFHAWEHRLAAVSKDRIVRPFDWGLPWLQNDIDETDRPADRVRQWVDAVMRDTPAFFDAAATHDYDFAASTADGQAKGEAGTLRFPSALVTPHPENNTVYGRWFPSKGEAPPDVRRSSRGRAVVVLPQWNSDPEAHIGLSRRLARVGGSA
jgi:hypothetical protein